MLFTSVLLVILGVILLVKGSGLFVGSASQIARKLGVSDFVIGLTLVALGTSLPELVSSIFASVKQQSGLVLGTIIGANIANLTLIIGVAAILANIKVDKQVLKRDGYILFFVLSLLAIFIYDGVISRVEGIFFVLLYVAYTISLVDASSKIKQSYSFADFARYFVRFGYLADLKKGFFLRFSDKKTKEKKVKGLSKHFIVLIIGLGLVYFAANVVVDKAVWLAKYFMIAPIVIGVLISIGTTLPELSVAISSSRKKDGEVAIGNAMGSCITNTLLILGVAAIIHPIEAMRQNMIMTIPFLLFSAATVLFFIKTDWKISKKEGIFLLLLYLGFLSRVLIG